MRTIQKQISLEPMTSRLPSVWPAYYNNVYYYFDDESLKEREWQYTSNWGMVPVNIVLNDKPYSSHTSDYYRVDTESCNFVLSFENLSKWYYFFNEYYNLLKQYSHCDRVYTSAEDYYNYESLDKYADQMIYGTEKQTYLDLDKEFADKGGVVYVKIFHKDTSIYEWVTPSVAHDEPTPDSTSMVDVEDRGFFKWICDNVVPSFKIPMEYVNYWKRDTLFYPNVVKWLAWFKERLHYKTEANFKEGNGGEVDYWNCKEDAVAENGNCCDCNEFFNKGGEKLYNLMYEWYKNIQNNIEINNRQMLENGMCHTPTIILPTELQVSIDDLGEFSIFSKDYELGLDYRTASYGDMENSHQGTVATMNGNSIILEEGVGYSFDEEYMEKYVSRCLQDECGYEGVFYGVCPKCGSKNVEVIGWGDYTEKYISEHRDEFYIPNHFKCYTYDDHNVKVTGSTLEELRNNLTKKFKITKREDGWMLIDGELYEINKTEYAKYDSRNKYLSNQKFLIFREDGTNTPYTFINGKKIFAEFYPPENKFYFPFFRKENASNSKEFNFNDYVTFGRLVGTDLIYYIEYDGNTYEVTASTMSIDGKDIYAISGYAMSDKNEMLYCLRGSNDVWYNNDGLTNYPNSSSNGDEVVVSYVDAITVYNADEIIGKTASKIYDLRLYNVLTDDIGNTIDGIYDLAKSGKYNHQPPEGEELELIYQVGNTANITRFSQTKENMDDITENKNYFVGDIITEMDFYYKDYSGEMNKDTLFKAKLDSDNYRKIYDFYGQVKASTTSGYTSLSAITFAANKKESMELNGKVFYDDIYCDITYYKGATLCREKDKCYNLADASRVDICTNHGVEYKETVRFVKTNTEYYLKKPKDINSVTPSEREKPCKHSISYPIYVYVLTQDMIRVDESQYDSEYSVAMADFKVDIDVFSGNSNTYSEKYPHEMEKRNGLQVFPVFREEYKFGNSIIENVDSDIYIDRGINAAYERHLKLGEVTSLEALEQYGNGYFKIMEN